MFKNEFPCGTGQIRVDACTILSLYLQFSILTQGLYGKFPETTACRFPSFRGGFSPFLLLSSSFPLLNRCHLPCAERFCYTQVPEPLRRSLAAERLSILNQASCLPCSLQDDVLQGNYIFSSAIGRPLVRDWPPAGPRCPLCYCAHPQTPQILSEPGEVTEARLSVI